MIEPVHLTCSTRTIALTLTVIPISNYQGNLTLNFNLNQGKFPLSEGNVAYGLTGGTLKLNLEEAHFTEFSEEINQFLPIIKSPTVAHPTWKFSSVAGSGAIELNFKGIPLGKIETTSENWSLEGTFSISKSDILVTEVEGLWRYDLRPNKHAVLDRKIALFLLETYFPSPLISLPSQESLVEMNPPTEAEICSLLTIIEQIKNAETDQFLELCEIAGLKPNQDFAGANLRGTTLRGLDFNGANWSRVNLRGADLTDVDLSQGNLQGAKLSGADLSGAYLSNANLKDADFHRASLALANLSGANLQGANLQEANLTQTNLSGCQLEGAIFDE